MTPFVTCTRPMPGEPACYMPWKHQGPCITTKPPMLYGKARYKSRVTHLTDYPYRNALCGARIIFTSGKYRIPDWSNCGKCTSIIKSPKEATT